MISLVSNLKPLSAAYESNKDYIALFGDVNSTYNGGLAISGKTKVMFEKSMSLNKVSMMYNGSAVSAPATLILEGSNDGDIWFSIANKNFAMSKNVFLDIAINENRNFKYYRFSSSASARANNIYFFFNDLKKILIKNNEEYYYYDVDRWYSLGSELTQQQIIDYGMDILTAQQINQFEMEFGKTWYPISWTNGLPISTATINATPYDQVLPAKNSIRITGIESATFKWVATGESRVALSVDDGATYHAFKNGIWIDVTNDMSNAMTANEYTAMTWNQFKILKGESNLLKHQYYIPDNSNVDDVLITANLIGSNQLANTNDYNLLFDQENKKINIAIKKTGTYSVNYADGK